MQYFRSLTATALLLCAGCVGLNKPAAPPLRYVIEPNVEVVKAENSGKTVAIRPLVPGRPYKQNVVYRVGAELHTYSQVEWAELPNEVATQSLIDALARSGRFDDSAKAVDIGIPNYVITGELRRFELLRDIEPWSAICEIRLEMREGGERKLVWDKTLSESVPLASNEVAALPTAMNTALSHIIERAVTEIVTK